MGVYTCEYRKENINLELCPTESPLLGGGRIKVFLRQTTTEGFVSTDLAWEMCLPSVRNLELPEARRHAWEEITVAKQSPYLSILFY